MTGSVLNRGRCALIKRSKGAGLGEFVAATRVRFGKVKLMKPVGSRARTPAMYLLAMQFRLV
jgi:23S rRNA U2552 (ribose-2'-O)-methylase RlmE/FtsJ